MNPIKATVYLADYQGTPPLAVVYASDVPIELTVADVPQFPANSTAEAYAKGLDTETVYINQGTATVTGNKIQFTPDHGFFMPGDNVLVVKVHHADDPGNGYTFPLTVHCKPNPAWGTIPANPVEVKGYAEVAKASAEQAVAVLEEIARDYPMVPDLAQTIKKIQGDLAPLNLSSNLQLVRGKFDTGTDIRTDIADNSRARSGVFRINGKRTVTPLTADFVYHIFKQDGEEIKQVTGNTYQSGPFVIDDADAIYRIFCRNASGSGSVTVDPDKDYFSLVADDNIVSRVDRLESELLTPALNSYIASVKADIQPDDYVFVLSSDNHYDEMQEDGAYQLQYARTIAEVAKRVGASAIVNLGDMNNADVDDYGTKDNYNAWVNRDRATKMVDAFISTKVPFLYAIGHHELFPNLGIVNGEAVYGLDKKVICDIAHRPLTYAPTYQDGSHSKPNYYVDDAAHNIRLVFLDSVSITNTGFSWATIEFAKSALANVPSGYRVAFFAHVPTRRSANANGTAVPGGSAVNWSATGTDTDLLKPSQLPDGIASYSDTIDSVINAYSQNGGKVIGYFHGHTHIDNVVRDEGMGYTLINECCQREASVSLSQLDLITSGGENKKRWKDRNNTDKCYCFDVVLVRANKVIMRRYGVGNDREISY